jgi:glycosyltransferase involved in cell wall biosynthesis
VVRSQAEVDARVVTAPHRSGSLVLFADLARLAGSASRETAHPDQGERVFVREIAAGLSRQISLVAYSTSREDPARFQQVGVSRLVSPRLLGAIWRQRPAAVLYVYPLTPAALVRARLMKAAARGAPVVVIGISSQPLGERARGAMRRLWPDLAVVSSSAERDRLAAEGCTAEVLPPAIDLDTFRPASPDEKIELRRKWGLPPGADVVLHVGHLVPARNLPALIAVSARPNTAVVMLASGVRHPESERLRRELETRGVMVLTGYRPDVAELYRASDCYLFASNSWGGGIDLPLSVLEAMASDLPVASTSFGALPELFAGADGILFADDAAELPALVDRLLRTRPRTRPLVAAYSWDALATHLLSLVKVARHAV